jgi:hypothetical protein
MMRRAILAGMTMLMAACQGRSGADASSESAASTLLQPGEWELIETREYASKTALGWDGEARVYERNPGPPRTCYYCLTADASAGPTGTLMTANEPTECHVDGIEMAGGQIRGVVDCGVSRQTVTGRFTRTQYQLVSQYHWIGSRDARQPDIRESRISGRRIGECPARPRDLSEQC